VSTLTEHFSLAELTASETAARNHLDNTPSALVVNNLLSLCVTVLEPIRVAVGRPVHINSGYRSIAVNAAIGGVVSSAHVDGRAADLIVPGMPLADVYDLIARLDLPIDQLIAEYGAWVHVAIARSGTTPRRQLLMKLSGRGYETYDAARAWS